MDASTSTNDPAAGARRADDAAPAGSAVLRAIRIAELILTSPSPLALADICRAVALPKPTVFRILATLEAAGVVGREPGSKRYHCGGRVSRMAGAILLNSPARAGRRAILEELVEQVGETCNLTVPNGHSVMLLERVETAWPLRIVLGAGSTAPMHVSASGKLFLAHLPPRARERFLRQCPLVRHTQKTITDPREFAAELERVRGQGFAVDDEEHLQGIGCLAVPVRDPEGRVVAAIAMHTLISRMCLDEAMQFLPTLQAAADAMAETLDW